MNLTPEPYAKTHTRSSTFKVKSWGRTLSYQAYFWHSLIRKRIILLIEHLRQEHLFEIRITPQARSIMSSLNDSKMQPKLHIIEKKLSP